MLIGQLRSLKIPARFIMGLPLPESNSESLNYSIYPYAEVDGKEYLNIEYSFFFRDVSGI